MALGDKTLEDNLAEINTILRKGVEDGVPGISAAISSANGLWKFTAGVSDLQSLQPIETTHLFGIGSITKVFVAVVIYQLVEEKKLRLSDAVSKYLPPEVCDGIDDAEGAPVLQLLGHEAGIDSWEDDPAWIRNGRGSELDPSHVWGKTEPLDYIRRPKQTAPDPGNWYYANTNYTLLGHIIEKVTQNTAEAEIRRRIFGPLGMEHINLEGFEPAGQGKLPHRYHFATETFRETAGICPAFPEVRADLIDCTESNLSTEWTAGGMVASATDLVKFATALRDGKLIGPESLRVMKDWRPAGTQEIGRGIFRLRDAKGNAWLGHFGGVLGFSAGLLWSETGDCVISVLSNVGSEHAGSVPSNAGRVILRSDFLEVALRLTVE